MLSSTYINIYVKEWLLVSRGVEIGNCNTKKLGGKIESSVGISKFLTEATTTLFIILAYVHETNTQSDNSGERMSIFSALSISAEIKILSPELNCQTKRQNILTTRGENRGIHVDRMERSVVWYSVYFDRFWIEF